MKCKSKTLMILERNVITNYRIYSHHINLTQRLTACSHNRQNTTKEYPLQHHSVSFCHFPWLVSEPDSFIVLFLRHISFCFFVFECQSFIIPTWRMYFATGYNNNYNNTIENHLEICD